MKNRPYILEKGNLWCIEIIEAEKVNNVTRCRCSYEISQWLSMGIKVKFGNRARGGIRAMHISILTFPF